jgi:DNA-binding transcriptional LysR family regulator
MQMNTAPFSQLQAFLAVARLCNFSSAARELGVSRSAVSQSVRQLEQQLRVVLLVRTTRSVALTEAGKQLVENAGPALRQAVAALEQVSARPGEAVGRVRLSVPRLAVPFVIVPVLPTFRERHPRVEVEVVSDERFVDIVAEGYDAGVRLSESIERDMVQVRLTAPFRFVVVGAPSYLARRGVPERPEQLLQHECITFRSSTTGNLYAWELERVGEPCASFCQEHAEGSPTRSNRRWRSSSAAGGCSVSSKPTPRRFQAFFSIIRAARRAQKPCVCSWTPRASSCRFESARDEGPQLTAQPGSCRNGCDTVCRISVRYAPGSSVAHVLACLPAALVPIVRSAYT